MPKTLAAIIALFLLLATKAQANIVEFQVVQSMSSLKLTLGLAGPLYAGSLATSMPQFVGSDVTSYVGRMFVDIEDNTIQLMPGASISAAIGAPGEGGVPGLFAPFDPVVAAPSPTIPGLNPNSNYGLTVESTGQKLMQYGLQIDNGDPSHGRPSTPMQLSGENFNLFGQAMSITAGREASWWPLQPAANGTRSLAGQTFLIFGSDNTDIGTWDGFTLILPVHSVNSFVVSNEIGATRQTVLISGQLVLVPVPEPSSVVLAAIGLIVLGAWCWRRC